MDETTYADGQELVVIGGYAGNLTETELDEVAESNLHIPHYFEIGTRVTVAGVDAEKDDSGDTVYIVYSDEAGIHQYISESHLEKG